MLMHSVIELDPAPALMSVLLPAALGLYRPSLNLFRSQLGVAAEGRGAEFQ